jgi:hypothetical protein
MPFNHPEKGYSIPISLRCFVPSTIGKGDWFGDFCTLFVVPGYSFKIGFLRRRVKMAEYEFRSPSYEVNEGEAVEFYYDRGCPT